MGKKHASQYANFGSLLPNYSIYRMFYNWLAQCIFCNTNDFNFLNTNIKATGKNKPHNV